MRTLRVTKYLIGCHRVVMLLFLKTNIGCMSCLNDCNVFPEGGGK